MKNINMEQQILGLLLDDGSRIAQCNLSIQDFSVNSHQVIFEAIQKVISDKHVVDVVSVGEAIEQNFGGACVDMVFMIELVTKCASQPQNMEYFSQVVKSSSELRKAKAIFNRALFDLDSDHDKKNVVSEAIKSLMELDRVSKRYEHTTKDAVIGALEAYEEAVKRGGLIGVTSGLSEVDEQLGGFHDSDLIILGARPAVGKTAMAINFAYNADVPVGFFSAEQSYEQIGARLICIEGQINSKNFRSASLTEMEYGRMPRTVENIKNKPIFFNDEPAMSISTIQKQARRWKQERKIGLLVVDYIQKIKGSTATQRDIERVTEVVLALKELAKELSIPIIGISKVTRAADSIGGPPGMGHLSDASICEYEADQVITLYRNDDMREKGKTLLHICKNRHGPTGDILVSYDGPYFKFRDSQSNVTSIRSAQ